MILLLYFRIFDLHEFEDIIFFLLKCQVKEIMLGQTGSQESVDLCAQFWYENYVK